MRSRGRWHAIVWLAGVCVTGTAFAQIGSLERLVMPGPVASAHADVEGTCSACHAPFARSEQNGLCLDCHEPIAEDLAARSGFHGRQTGVAGAGCSSCHTEHEGRGADILGLDVATFDHGSSDFPLRGKHTELTCTDCHVPEEPSFSAAETECVACHADDDRHRGNLGSTCTDCHSETGWADARFDHASATDYALTGKHSELTCASCHVEEVYERTPTTCASCHAEDDSHRGSNGVECQDCHTTRDWQETSFEHFSRTGFGLTGGHSGLTCESCHEGSTLARQTPNECIACHREDDVHAGVNGGVCSDCHRVTEWLDVTFDHGRDTEFALRGGHADVACADCHEEPVAVALPGDRCVDCHLEDDAHTGQLGGSCEACHSDSEVVWTRGVRFDHDLARFPLLGKHDPLECGDCHATPAFHDAGDQCIDCHAEDDAHERRLGSDCAACHNPNDWRAWLFDHDAQTDFALSGAHAGLSCLACHREPVVDALVLDATCAACHRSDDAHRGEFGRDCGQCHVTDSFRNLKDLQ